jgi:16S rRNA (cytidine1402-2'-O)-methyltransferase
MTENNEQKLEPALYLVSTPIGNMGDITLRAISVLSQADCVACEDTRHTGNLLKMLEIHARRLTSYHEHNELVKSKQLIDMILSGSSVALVSDAGTPSVSDPGYRIVAAAIEAGVRVVPIPGASAALAALVGSGAAVNRFAFWGFPPQKKGRRTFVQNLLDASTTVIIYESPNRIIKLIEAIVEQGGADRHICIAREITKLNEEFLRGTAGECLANLKSRNSIKGELVVVVDCR